MPPAGNLCSRPSGRLSWPRGRGPFARLFYFDDVYAAIIVLPIKVLAWISRLLFENIFIGLLHVCGWIGEGLSSLLRRLQTGRVEQYAAFILVATALAAWFLLRG